LWQRRWWWAGAIAISLIIFPVWQTKSTLVQITAISAPGEPVLIIQDRGKTALVNSGDENTANFTLLPFLQQQGVNQIDWAVALKSSEKGSSGWTPILKRLPVKTFYTNASLGEWQIGAVVRRAALKSIKNLPIGETLKTGSAVMELIEREPNILQLQIGKQTWLILGDVKLTEQKRLALGGRLPPAQVLWWTGEGLSSDVLRIVKPEVAIASAAKIDPQTLKNLRQNKTKIYRLSRNRTLQWTLGKGFETSMEATDSDTPML
jgi:competence protein ComEC